MTPVRVDRGRAQGTAAGDAARGPHAPHRGPGAHRAHGHADAAAAGARLLDLFAGAGGVGSRRCRAAPRTRRSWSGTRARVAALRANVEALGRGGGDGRAPCATTPCGRSSASRGEGERFDLVFLDPPYDGDLVAPHARAARRDVAVVPDGALVIAQHFTKRAAARERPAVSRAFRTRRFGETTLTFFRAGGYDPASRG